MTSFLEFNNSNSKYSFYSNQSTKFTAVRKNKFLTSQFILFDSSNTELGTIVKKGILSSTYIIHLKNNVEMQFSHFGGMKMNYELKSSQLKYFLYGHKGLKTSIFYQEKQIGFFEQNKKNVKGNIMYSIEFNLTTDLMMIFLLVLLWSISSDTISNDAPDINYNYGNIGPQEFAFDEKWKAEG